MFLPASATKHSHGWHPYGSEESLEKQDIQRLCVAVEHPRVV